MNPRVFLISKSAQGEWNWTEEAQTVRLQLLMTSMCTASAAALVSP